ncbi:carboxymuconolactone decarboxylase family protein [Mycobacterium sp. 852002-51057_SCH5723018]|uniref:carboxymuconolactone decarboxylase family protein n=1 Tax=Mycobacterium sp. 852002-51057_SCH5723018 TaxID=1834094 RepID=UPI000801CDAD|nr:carboxymuconolactone decarboxylase family protein [Mycobacterium sp. 852002-51057_SCH5723018]OBG28800.1 carboxymuconolactone decarboxylase [Mycobacterium sp. 852002-51057_SCH5723018]
MRLTPLPDEEWGDETRAAVAALLPPERANARDAGNVLATMVRHPRLTRAYLRFNAHLLRDSTLPVRPREVALLRVVHRRGCAYLWSHHVPIARRAGLSAAEIEAIRCDEVRHDPDRVVVRAVDELHEHGAISDATWAELGRHFDERQRMDLVFTVGGYGLLAMAVNTFEIEDEGHHG